MDHPAHLLSPLTMQVALQPLGTPASDYDCQWCWSHHEYCQLHFGYKVEYLSTLLLHFWLKVVYKRWHNGLLISTLLGYVCVPVVSQLLKLLLKLVCFFLSVSKLPCTLQLVRTMSARWSALLTKELIPTSKIMMG